MDTDKPIRLALVPATSEFNPFVDQFAKCFSTGPFLPARFGWKNLLRGKMDVVIFHWPNEFFASIGPRSQLNAIVKIAVMMLSRLVYGVEFYWVAHNVAPHEDGVRSPRILHLFFRQLRGIIYLSFNSEEIIQATYPFAKRVRSLVTRLGHYREMMKLPAVPKAVHNEPSTRLSFFGQIRLYKNVERLILCVTNQNDMSLSVVGVCFDAALEEAIRDKAARAPNVKLDIRRNLVPEEDMETAIDESHAVVVPFKAILNSSSILLALSRNRPVLAPRIGSLPEVQKHVGEDWLSLYDGDISTEIIQKFCARLRTWNGSGSPNLDAYDWQKIGEELRAFIRRG